MFAGALRHADHEGRAFGVLHDRPHLVDDEQAGLGVLGGCGPHRLGADHRGGGAKLRLQEPQVEDGDQGLVAEQVVALVGEQVAQAAGGEGPEQAGQSLPRTRFEVAVVRLALLQKPVRSRGSRSAPSAGRSSPPERGLGRPCAPRPGSRPP